MSGRFAKVIQAIVIRGVCHDWQALLSQAPVLGSQAAALRVPHGILFKGVLLNRASAVSNIT